MKIQLKRSNVLDGGSAKKPTAAQMEFGELAVNYNKDDPSVFFKDSDNNIVKVGGDLGLYLRLDASNDPITSDLTVEGDVTATSFRGDGSNLTGIEVDTTALTDDDGNIIVQASSTGISVTGTITATNNITAYSDASLKENIQSIPNALNRVLQLRGVEFDRTDLDGEHQIGVVAQEVESVIPEVVATGEEGLKSVAYGNLVGLLIEAIKDLNAEVSELKAKLEG